ncbi:helicase associated domain-containing protein [Streptomyces sp. NPDC004014]
MTPTEAPAAAPAAQGAATGSRKAGNKAQQAFQRGLAALTQWVERERQRPARRNTVIEITIDGEAEPVPVRLGVWISNTKQRRDKLTAQQLDALRELGVGWA